MKNIIPVVIASLLSAFIAVFIYQQVHIPDQIVIRETMPVAYNSSEQSALMPAEFDAFASVPRDFVQASNVARRAVVSIQAKTGSNYFWRNDQYSSSSGSGVIISSDGYIATNKHVIDEGEEISVTLHDQRVYEARVIGKDPTTDLALLKIDVEGLPVVQFGNSDSLFVGDWVLAIGNPFRLQSTVTAGIVSAKSRNISIMPDQTGIEAFIQTDAAVNPGNSGGALVNTKGELVGINTAIITYSGQYEGFSFAVPSNLAHKVLFDLRDFGSVQRGWLGVQIRSVDDRLAKELKLSSVKGVYIDEVTTAGAASTAGLRARDVIIGINNQPVNGSSEFMEQVGRMRPGDRIVLEFIREGKKNKTDVVLSANPNSAANADAVAHTSMDPTRATSLLETLGMKTRELSPTECKRLGLEGVVVEEITPGSRVDRINMTKDYIITSVNGKSITNIPELAAAIDSAPEMIILDGIYEHYDGKFPYAFRK